VGLAGLGVDQQHRLEVHYRNTVVGDFVADLLVEGSLIVGIKALGALDDIHTAQCVNYLKATGLQVCLLVNFGLLKASVKRIAYGFLIRRAVTMELNRRPSAADRFCVRSRVFRSLLSVIGVHRRLSKLSVFLLISFVIGANKRCTVRITSRFTSHESPVTHHCLGTVTVTVAVVALPAVSSARAVIVEVFEVCFLPPLGFGTFQL
jgi:GxxExxY protein